MQKDVIYIDTEDDITAIIGKVKASSEHIVALVPPKRIGAIQSAVNLKLVHRAAEQVDKRLVIISNNAALMALAGSAGIPVAKNLQSKPELAEIPVLDIDDGEDVIDGSELAAVAPSKKDVSEDTAASEVIAEEESSKNPKLSKATPKSAASALGATALAAKNKVKIPDFDKFRKKLVLIIGGLLLLIGFGVWATVFAPRATIVITARASESALNTQVKLGDALATDLKAGTIKSVTKTSKKSVSQPFTATGKKDVGTKATGSVRLAPTRDTLISVRIDGQSVTIPAGTIISSESGLAYLTGAAVTFDDSNTSAVTVGVTAAENGAKYNGASGSASKSPSGTTATFTTTTSGGTDKTVTIVQQSDVEGLMDKLVAQSDIDTAKKELTAQLGGDYVVLDSSFKTDTQGVKPSPAVGAESPDGKGAVAGDATFSLVAVQKAELGKFLDTYFARQVDGKTNQKVYENGAKTVSFTTVSPTDGGYSATITTNGKIGPKIDEVALKEFAKGKRLGEIQLHVKEINGVDTVDVNFSPFWVSSAPNDGRKIKVEFKVNDK